MFEKKIIHRDLKPENIFIKYISLTKDDYIVKLGDIGISREYQQKNFSTKMGAIQLLKFYMQEKKIMFKLNVIYGQLVF